MVFWKVNIVGATQTRPAATEICCQDVNTDSTQIIDMIIVKTTMKNLKTIGGIFFIKEAVVVTDLWSKPLVKCQKKSF